MRLLLFGIILPFVALVILKTKLEEGVRMNTKLGQDWNLIKDWWFIDVLKKDLGKERVENALETLLRVRERIECGEIESYKFTHIQRHINILTRAKKRYSDVG